MPAPTINGISAGRGASFLYRFDLTMLFSEVIHYEKPPDAHPAASPDRSVSGKDDREDAAKEPRKQAESLTIPPVTLAGRRKLLAVREREANRRLADAAHQCAERLRRVTVHLDRQIDGLDLPAQERSLAVIGAALLRIEQEAQRQLPWLCRDGGGGP